MEKEKKWFKDFDGTPTKGWTKLDKYYHTKYDFNYTSVEWKTDGMIYLSACLIAPLFISILAKLFFGLSGSQGAQLTVQLLQIVCALIGMVVLWQRDPKGFWRSGRAWFFVYSALPLALSIVAGIILAAIPGLENGYGQDFTMMVISIANAATILALMYKLDKVIFFRIRETFKLHWKSLLVTAIIGFIILFSVSNLLFGIVFEKIIFKINEQSQNQQNLYGPLSDANASTIVKVIYAMLLFIYAVALGPLLEEFVFRNSWFTAVSNKWLAFVTSSIMFGFLHYGTTGDFEHALSYTSAGFVLGGVFLFSKGNLTHTWMVHLLNNAVSFALMFIPLSV
ncbi:CAAX amino terminal membrane bound protease [Spiroplasma chinense]|uniref:CAAX amino terminal membrane bound protease n=1 Tax=Spiroplasma chinense TaxID=216932 RepID=A0A5B9Y315_9MOLU|nr:type II CAAX endopeptidase family protein [Spiroplasma chinense]QEH61351.1 CAAX amino terminal membrane bound protease [Spiroplasma chinense]